MFLIQVGIYSKPNYINTQFLLDDLLDDRLLDDVLD